MSAGTPRRKWRWLRHVAWVLAANFFLIVAGVIIFFGSGAGNPLIRRFIVHRLEVATGCSVQLRGFSMRWLSLQPTLTGLVIHGREPADTEPLFAADEIRLALRIDSFWGRKLSLDELFVQRPQIHVRIEKDGSTNLLLPRSSSGKSAPGRLFDLRIRRVQFADGWVLYNNVRTPLALEGSGLQFALDAANSSNRPLYLGSIDWQRLNFTWKHFLPLPLTVSAKFTLSRDGFVLEQGILTAAHSRLDAHAEMQDFAQPQWTFRYRGWVNLRDIRETFRSPETPTGLVDVHGEASFASGQFRANGNYSGRDINLDYRPIYHATALASRGHFRIDNNGLEVPDFLAEAYNGTVKGRVALRFAGLKFRADTRVQDVRLSGVWPDIDHPGFPIDALHWDALLSADTIETWTAGFQHFELSAKMHWADPTALAPGHIPVQGDWNILYNYDSEHLAVTSGQFETSSSRGSIAGLLDPKNTLLDVRFQTGELDTYRDFINAIREAKPKSRDEIRSISGSVSWNGRIAGPSGGPSFSGHIRGEGVHYENLNFDSLDGDLTYSPTQLIFADGHVSHGAMRTDLDVTLALTQWSFLPHDTWTADMNLQATPLGDIQRFFHWSYPVHGKLSGQFHAHGTAKEPVVTGLFDLADGDVYGATFSRLRGQINLSRQEARISDAELRVFPPGKENGRGAGIVTGSAAYNFADRTFAVDLVGASLPLENFGTIQSAGIPLAGRLTFRIKASGPLTAPQADGSFRVVDMRLAQTVIGSFEGAISSDGQVARLELGSAMTTGEISGKYSLGLAEPFPLQGMINIKNIELDAFLESALHLRNFNVRGKADGTIATAGDLRHPESISFEANFSRLLLNYANVQLENAGPVRFRSSRQELNIEPATFRGTDTDIKVDGSVHFAETRALDLRLNGALDLRLITSFVPGLEVGGAAQVNAAFAGTLDRPRISGRIHIANAAARMTDFPTGLSAINGDFVFDATRLFFDNLTAQAGGGTLRLAGSLNYDKQPLRYDITARTESVRIRYPEGMSWLVGGSLRLTGTPEAALLSGRVAVDRVLLTEGLEVAGVFASGNQGISGPSTGAPFLRNLQFDIEATSTPGARMEWPGAQLEAEAGLRVRGTWEHPILLGHIHVLTGDLLFHGNHYRVARGDLNFSNPFRLDPEVNVEATTNIQQYEVTLNFTGQASKLSLSYRSDPPLPGDDIIALLALGQTTSESMLRTGGTAQTGTSGTAGASAILSEAVSNKLGGRLEQLFGITRFRVDPGLTSVGSTGAEQNAAARVTVEQQVTRNLNVTYVSNVGSTQEQVIQVELILSKTLSVVALRDYNGTFGIDFKIKKRFP